MSIIETIDLLSSSPGTHRQLKIHRFGQMGARPKAYIQAALHADEYPSLLVAQHLIDQLQSLESRQEIVGEIIVVPVANPIGLSQRVNDHHLGRYELSGGGNFNRNWPDLTEDVADRIEGQLTDDVSRNVELIREALARSVSMLSVQTEFDHLRKSLLHYSIGADVVLDLHSDCQALPHLYSSVHHASAANELSCELGAKVLLLETEAGGNPFDECNAGVWWKLKQMVSDPSLIPLAGFSATVEFRGQMDVRDDLASEDARGLISFLKRQGLIEGESDALPAPECEATPLEGVDLIRSPKAGVLVFQKKLGDWVNDGDVIAQVVDPMAHSPAESRISLRSNTQGILFAHVIERLVVPGSAVAKVAGKVPLKHRRLGHLLEA